MRDDPGVRTTLDIDDDGAMRQKTAGQVVSELMRRALEPTQSFKVRNGVPLLPRKPGARIITTADVRRWVDEDD